MDKETLSNYGWIVICVLVLAVMIALATPFGNFIAGAIKSTTAGFFSVNQNAMNAGGITIPGQNFDDQTNAELGPGLYETGSNYTVLKTSWQDLLDTGVIHVTEDGLLYTNFDISTFTNNSSDALSGDLVLPLGITALGDFDMGDGTGNYAFIACASLTGIQIPDSVTTIGYGAFGLCTSLKSLTIPASVTSIGEAVIYGSGVTDLTLYCEYVTDDAFSNSDGLINLTLGDTVAGIGYGAFQSCGNLTNMIIGTGLQYVSDMAFQGTKNITHVYYKGTEEQWDAISFGQTQGGPNGAENIVFNYTDE